ncbi:N-acetylmuramoyl-L-alanine amidase [Prevotella sp. HMSC077E09]|jgi:N-acetylmuramoyl-L-alanine amidase, family 3|uniref:N-acetylmuramoyl-L-alanine amidase n=3 Tax=Bacteroidales TaxID=171549 RepID=A0A3S4TG42_9BACT|nr:N-acetylmuramoyl-L-alanine amidase, family 3 [Segatella oris C735]OFO73232.1 N-acetylmuramoyl-L-alanine amidase [Prevotella sp. HMSC077E08]OFP57765.1 N-acetylmuramoyl-L-alanine amidase [Prevotella sp. HMSC077E09]VEH16222.1 N-acetylmuramoyl-L-alanine amidase AmiB precursor [Segatella oris]
MLLFAVAVMAANRKFTLVIDAGHGGTDHGAPGSYSKEKDLTLKYALAFGRYVEDNSPDVRVVYTRKTDVFVTLAGRADIANKCNADLFLSFHINAVTGSKSAHGFQSWTLGRGEHSGDRGIKANLDVAKRENSVMFLEKDYKTVYKGFDTNSSESDIMYEFIADKNREKSVELSRLLQQYVCASTGRVNGGSHQNNLAVLRLTSMPSCLLELGFISTPDEEDFLNDDASVALYVKGVYNAFMKYRQRYGNDISVPYKPIKEEPTIPQVVPSDYRKPAADNPAPRKSKRRVERKSAEADNNLAKVEPPHKEGDVQVPNRVENDKPVFKVQLLVSSNVLKSDDNRFKGLTNIESYKEGLYKYTYGASTNYNEIYRLRKQILDRFPDAFIVAFKNGNKMDINAAIQEFKLKR